jgi:hypothetical protein
LKIHPKLSNDGLSQAEVKKKLLTEDKIEHLYFFKNGKQIARFEGESNYVNPAENQLIKMKDCEVLHNHLEGTSFSVEDVVAIISYDAQSLEVVSDGYVYSVFRPKKGWGFEFKMLKDGSVFTDQQTFNSRAFA